MTSTWEGGPRDCHPWRGHRIGRRVWRPITCVNPNHHHRRRGAATRVREGNAVVAPLTTDGKDKGRDR